MAQFNDNYYTKYANKLIKSLNLENTIQIFEETTIDGCDRHGPKAYIYYLYVIQHNPTQQNQYTYQIYTADQYFEKNEVVEYELYISTQSNKLKKFKSWEDFHKIKKENENENKQSLN